MLPDPQALAVAAIFALAALLPLSGRNILRSLSLLCLIVGGATWFLTREAPLIIWDEWLGPMSGLTSVPSAVILRVMIAAAVAEILKATAPLAAVSFTSTDAPTGLAYGAAAGAGFSVVSTLPVVARTLELVGSPIVTPLSTAIALIGWFFPMLLHVSTTAYVARAGVRGGLGLAFFVAWILHVTLGLADALPLREYGLIGGIPIKFLLTAVVAVSLFAYLWVARARSQAAPVAPS